MAYFACCVLLVSIACLCAQALVEADSAVSELLAGSVRDVESGDLPIHVRPQYVLCRLCTIIHQLSLPWNSNVSRMYPGVPG